MSQPLEPKESELQEKFRASVRGRVRPKLQLKPLSPEKQALADAYKEQSKKAEAERQEDKEILFDVFDKAREEGVFIEESAFKHLDELGVSRLQLKGFIEESVTGFGLGSVTFGPRGSGKSGPSSFTFSIKLANAIETYGESLSIRLASSSTYKSIMGEVPARGPVKVFHAF